MAIVACLAGQIGSGKSSVTQALSEKLNWRRAGFGDFLRQELHRRAVLESREELQNLGKTFIDTNPEEFCRATLAMANFVPGENLIVDGVRHVQIFKMLSKIAAPSIAKLIFLSADESVRMDRVARRDSSVADWERAKLHAVEAELATALPFFADAIVDARRPIEDLVIECESLLYQWA